ncbi:hypothetical protein Taro_021818 [Colocasia esculenta]|uniref:RNase H type-1 domain-containing protein n=1 Tax=Colocasia esculenta TaxID=4460 RepID=A0A843V9D5_COLES|nr:hypothetical protein [Colocasia esculenta]
MIVGISEPKTAFSKARSLGNSLRMNGWAGNKDEDSTIWVFWKVQDDFQGFIATYAVLLLLWEIWKHRCAKRFDSSSKSVGKIIADIRYAINVALQGVTFKQECAANSLAILQTFGFKPKVKLKAPKIVRWIPPQHGVCLNVDGACMGNPGPCSGGGSMRNSAGDILLGFAFYYGYGDSLLTEVRALADGLRLAKLHGFNGYAPLILV